MEILNLEACCIFLLSFQILSVYKGNNKDSFYNNIGKKNWKPEKNSFGEMGDEIHIYAR